MFYAKKTTKIPKISLPSFSNFEFWKENLVSAVSTVTKFTNA